MLSTGRLSTTALRRLNTSLSMVEMLMLQIIQDKQHYTGLQFEVQSQLQRFYSKQVLAKMLLICMVIRYVFWTLLLFNYPVSLYQLNYSKPFLGLLQCLKKWGERRGERGGRLAFSGEIVPSRESLTQACGAGPTHDFVVHI